MGMKGRRLPGDKVRPEPMKPKPNGDTNRSLIDIELALADHFNWKKNIIAFNVLGVSGRLPIDHECDMLVVTSSGYLCEVEIKRSYADFCADFKKRHHHTSAVPMKEFIFAVPQGILDKVITKLEQERFIPSRIIIYDEDLHIGDYPVYQTEDSKESRERKEWYWSDDNTILLLTKKDEGPVIHAVDINHSGPIFLEQRLEVARLGAMRQVSLRKKFVEQEKRLSQDPDVKLINEIEELKILLREYRVRYREETGNDIDEKEVLYG